ncbi:WD repeat-containing protein 62 isoform X2 [Trematomus bernacchii]|uniref:WD repeat-containing protein 62 isoform X2 n=1 Tax=Trematomus bernacchii TaxID=40690 RepID=UPI001469A13F|nr:WD repeat-containing protein 62 isoform X2 [Trematomus bernacchii]
MAEVSDPEKRRGAAGRKSQQSRRKRTNNRVTLEKVLGISTSSSSGLTSDPKSGLIAYPAGCVIVLLHPKTNKQSHIVNTSRKPFSALAFSHDGKHLVTGESGHMPCVRVWELEGGQVAEVQSHKYGVSCVAFSTNSCYVVSVGYQHDKTVSVWDWRKGSIIASNNVSSRVSAVSFSQDNSYFVTAGNRHVKFWYLDASKERRVNSTVPLIGRSGLLGDHKNSVFSGVACGRGPAASSTYCITSSGLLCLFNSSRQLEAWVDLKTSSASCLAVSEDFIFCGCADGAIRAFSPSNLQYVTTLHRPHRLGVDLTQSLQHSPGAQYPDTLALTFDPASRHLTCVYNDHSVYVWDVKDVRNVGKLYSALYHSSCVWSIEVYPELLDASQACLPPSSFLTCSSDNTVRLWNTDPPIAHRNLYSNDLLRIVYVGENMQHLQAEGGEAGADGKAGIRVLGVSPDGKHLAAGDRCGNLRIFGLEFLDELVKIEAHDSEVLCLEFSPISTGVKLLASASRDRLIHVFNLEKNYSLEQTLSDHSASITAIKFTGESPEVRMVSCGADKSIYFQTAEQTAEGPLFSRSHHVVEKTTLYDMDLDSTRTHVAIACQDRNIRVYNVETGKLKKCLKGSSSDEGALLKVQMDPSGSFFATSCSDKNISIFDYETGECVSTLFGHSEIVTCMRFSEDCKHLITVSGDSCVFIWRLDSQMTSIMKKRRGLKMAAAPEACSRKLPSIRRETFITGPSSQLPHMEEEEEEEEVEDLGTPDSRPDSAHEAQLLQTNGKLPLWFRKLHGQGGASAAVQSVAEPHQVRSRWAEQRDPLNIVSNFSPSPTQSPGEEEEEQREEEEEQREEEEGHFHPQSLESLLVEEEEEEEEDGEEVLQNPGEKRSSYILYPDTNTTTDREFDVQGVTDPRLEGEGAEPVWSRKGAGPIWSSQLSPDSALSEGSAGSLEQQQDADTDSLSQGSSVGSLVLEEDEDSLKIHFDTLASGLTDEKFDTDLRALLPPDEKHYLNPRLSISTAFLSRFQDRIRFCPSRAPPPAMIPTRISEESYVSNSSVNSEASSEVSCTESTQKETSFSGAVLRRRASSMISHQSLRRLKRRRHTVVHVQCRDMLQDVTSRTLNLSLGSAAQQGALRLGYLGTTASSRAKKGQDPASEEKENLDLQSRDQDQDQTCSPQEVATPPAVMSLDGATPPAVMSLDGATPPAVMSLGGVRRWSLCSEEETLTNQNLTIIISPSPTRDTIASDIIEQEAGHPGEVFRDTSPASSSSPLTETQHPPPVAMVSLLQCQSVAMELREATRRAVLLHQQLSDGTQPPQLVSVLKGAFDFVLSELQAVRGEDEASLSLLEKYSELLVQMTREKLDRV